MQKHLIAILFDIEKVNETTWREYVEIELELNNIQENMLQFIHNFFFKFIFKPLI